LANYDPKKCFEHPLAWEAFLERISRDPLSRGMSVKEALTVFQALQRSMQVLGIEIPRVDVVHCSLAWIPSLVALVAKAEYGCPIVVTEHGVAYRELMLYYNAYLFNEPSKIFWKVFARNVVRPIYEMADVIAPVCQANAGWETALGADPSKIRVIYNGIDTERFKPSQVRKEGDPPTVVSVARIDPFKDITTLAYAIKYARERIPNIRCLVFGDSNNLDYSLRCVKVVKAQNLEPNFTFMGGTKEPEKAYNLGDIVVFNGITEGFPFAVIEAMACGKAIVATAVGGVAEALEGCGILVKSRDPETLANGIVRLLTDERLRNELGQAALKRARSEFSLETSIYRYKALYEELVEQSEGTRRSVQTEEVISR
ncbi:MAG TPA: GT4 family glycosyltransferase PelF, partial [Nitrososphaerales archaeon]|nr:GT4 family glycosyltransferase PelF [Nitrososphaerales archaeon]